METSLINWINTFDLSKKVAGLSDLSDGLILNEICCLIAPSYFKLSGLRSVEELEDNWVLKSENIKTLLNGIDSFFKDIGISCGVDSVDIDAVSNSNKSETIRLIELVLGVLLECEHNSEYIGKFMELDQDSQADLMVVLERIKAIHSHQLAGHSRSMSFSEHQLQSLQQQQQASGNLEAMQTTIDQLKKDKDNLQNTLDEAKSDLSQVVEERNKLADEKTRIQEVVSDLQGSLESLQKQFDEAKHQSSMNVMTDEKIKEDINTLHIQIENKEKQIQDQKKKIDELQKLVNENRSLRDEIDILKEKAVAAEVSEKKLKIYEKKMDEVNDLKKKIKELEDQNQQYLSQTLDLEEELTKSNSLKTQAETNKQTISSLKVENTKLELSLKSITEEREKLQSQIATMDLEKESLQSQITSLRNNLTHIQEENESKLLELQTSMSSGGGLGDQLIDPVANEKIIRLERENKKLKERASELEKQIDESSQKMEDLKRSHQESLNQLQSTQPNQNNNNNVNNEILESIKLELQKANSANDDLKKELVELYSTQQRTEEPKESTDMTTLKAENEKLQGYLRAAKDMIKKLREKLKDNQTNELQLNEKDEYIVKLQQSLRQKTEFADQLYKQLKEAKEESSKELNLMLSAVYARGAIEFDKLQHNKSEPKSFLNKKRDL